MNDKKRIVVICSLVVIALIFLFAINAKSLVMEDAPACAEISTVVNKVFTTAKGNNVIISLKIKTVDMDGKDITAHALKINGEFIDALKRDKWEITEFEVAEDTGNGSFYSSFRKESFCGDVKEINKFSTDILLEISEDIAGGDIIFRNMISEKNPKSLFGKKVCRGCLSNGQDDEKKKSDRDAFYKEALGKINDSIF